MATSGNKQPLVGAVAKEGARKAAAASPANPGKKKRSKRKGSALQRISADDQATIRAWESYAHARTDLLRTTGSATLETAEVKAMAALQRLEAQKRAQRRASSEKSTGVHGSGRSVSVRTVSGGAPTLGRRR